MSEVDVVARIESQSSGNCSFDRVTELTDLETEEVRTLSLAVYSPEETADWEGRLIEWASPEWCVRVRDDSGTLVSYIGVYLREATCDGCAVLIGGIGNVKTHPKARGRGFAMLGLERALTFFDEQDVAFGLLVCNEELIGYYTRSKWRLFSGRLMVRQRGEPCEFTYCRVMTRSCRSEGPIDGTIDLNGPPW